PTSRRWPRTCSSRCPRGAAPPSPPTTGARRPGASSSGAVGDQVLVLAFEDRLAALVGEGDLECQQAGGALALERHDLVARLDRVADEGWPEEARSLLEERDDRVLDQRRHGRRAHGGQRREQQPVGEALAEARALDVLVVVVERVRVAGEAGEEQ